MGILSLSSQLGEAEKLLDLIQSGQNMSDCPRYSDTGIELQHLRTAMVPQATAHFTNI